MNQLIKMNGTIYRILAIEGESLLMIDCMKRTMPKWCHLNEIGTAEECLEQELLDITGVTLMEENEIKPEARCEAHRRFTIIAGILSLISDDRLRTEAIKRSAEEWKICTQTVRNYLCMYLIYQSLSVLVPQERTVVEKELTVDEKNFRRSLNKYYFTRHKNSLKTAYTYMLKERYCDEEGKLLPKYPSFNQFRYFYSKYKTEQTLIISRNGLKDYQRNYRPLVGDGVQSFSANVGYGMIDSTICDIHLVDEQKNIIGRPVLTILTDSYSNGFVLGYALSWEGGTYSLRELFLNVIADKVEWCRKFGIMIETEQWNCNQMPSVIVSDMGSEYQSTTLSQITELGITLINLPPLRPELKSIVERSFQLLQDSLKPMLMDYGYIDKDAGKRLAPDYRKNASLTIQDYEKAIIRSIIYHNTKRVLENYPYTEEMILAKVKPYSSDIFEWGRKQPGSNLITVTPRQLVLTLMARTNARFTRKGLVVFGLRYDSKERNFTEDYLKNTKKAVVAYNPESADKVFLLREGEFIEFHLIESRFSGKSFEEIKKMQSAQREIVNEAVYDNLQGRIDLTNHIERIVGSAEQSTNINLKDVRKTKQRAKRQKHRDFVEEVELSGKYDDENA